MKKCFIHNTGVLCPGTNCGMGIFLDDATEQTTHVECSECGVCKLYLSQNAKRASARKDTGLAQSLFSVQLFRLRINIMKVCKGSI